MYGTADGSPPVEAGCEDTVEETVDSVETEAPETSDLTDNCSDSLFMEMPEGEVRKRRNSAKMHLGKFYHEMPVLSSARSRMCQLRELPASE